MGGTINDGDISIEEYWKQYRKIQNCKPVDGLTPYQPHPQHPCPSCGHCPTCGRGGGYTRPYWPSYPQVTWAVPMSQTAGRAPFLSGLAFVGPRA